MYRFPNPIYGFPNPLYGFPNPIYGFPRSAWLQGRRPQRQIGKILLEGFFLPIFSDACFRGVDVRSHHLILQFFFHSVKLLMHFGFGKHFNVLEIICLFKRRTEVLWWMGFIYNFWFFLLSTFLSC